MMGALYAAFWLQLEGASSAMVCVAILALPTRGQTFEKAAFRFLATAIGVIVSIAIGGLFAQTRELFILAFAIWLGLCVYVASFFGGNRAYGAVLSGYTVALVAVTQIETPGNIFLAGVNRGAAIAVGIAAVALVNDMFVAPNIHPGLATKIRLLHQEVNKLVLLMLREGHEEPYLIVSTFKQITAFHVDIMALAAETSAGRIRAAAARSAVAALGEQIAAARAFSRAQRASKSDLSVLRAKLIAALDEKTRNIDAMRSNPMAELSTEARTLEELVAISHAADVLDRERLAVNGLADIDAKRMPERLVRLPVHRVRQIASRNAIRAGGTVALAAALLSFSGWPEAILAVALVGIIGSLSATTPNPGAFTKLAILAVGASAIMAGFMQFVVLDGADDFPIFGLVMAPPIFVICFLMSSSSPVLKPLGALVLLLFAFLLSPSNPQTYNPESFLFSSVLALTAVILASVLLNTIFPTSDQQNRRWLLDAALSDLREARANRHPRSEPARTYRAHDRLAHLAGLKAESDTVGRQGVVDMLFLIDLAAAVSRAHDLLNNFHGVADSDRTIIDARRGLAHLDPLLLRRAAAHIAEIRATGVGAEVKLIQAVAAALAWTSLLIVSERDRMHEFAAW
jgi:uncharacterized membrane protein YccC